MARFVSIQELFSFSTEPGPCAYLPHRSSRFRVRGFAGLEPDEYARLLEAGWRRFGRTMFAPACSACRECVPIRIPVRAFRPSKSQRRVLSKNRDVTLEIGEPRVDDERLELYRRFHAARSRTRGWPPAGTNPGAYVETFLDNAAPTLEFRYRLGRSLVGIAYVGEASNALNSIYAYIDPRLGRRSLGTFDVLTEIQETARRGKEHLYLGYYVAGCQSMAYKASFSPHELLRDGSWLPG
jgi:arginine-tRNA-protein transferase